MTNPKLATKGPGGRWYEIPDPIIPGGWRGPSVTTVLSNGLPAPALKAWGERLVAEYAVDNIDAWRRLNRSDAIDHVKRAPFRQLNAAGNRGTDIHTIAERILDGINPNSWEGQTYGHHAQHIADFLDDYEVNVLGYEKTVVNDQDGYAGSYDLLARINNETWLIDWKTSKSVYGKFGVQLAAYANATWQITAQTAEPMPAVDRLGVVHLTDVGYRFIPVEARIEDLYEIFQAALVISQFTITGERHVLGEPENAVPRSTVRDDLRQRLADLLERNPHVGQEIADAWPRELPTLKAEQLTRRQLYIIEQLITRFEHANPGPRPEPANFYDQRNIAQLLATLPKRVLEPIKKYADSAGIPNPDGPQMDVEQLAQLDRIIRIIRIEPAARKRAELLYAISQGRTTNPVDISPEELDALEAASNAA